MLLALASLTGAVSGTQAGWTDDFGWSCRDYARAPTVCLSNPDAASACPSECSPLAIREELARLQAISVADLSSLPAPAKPSADEGFSADPSGELAFRRRLTTNRCEDVIAGGTTEMTERVSCNAGSTNMKSRTNGFIDSLFQLYCTDADCEGIEMYCFGSGNFLRLPSSAPTRGPTDSSSGECYGIACWEWWAWLLLVLAMLCVFGLFGMFCCYFLFTARMIISEQDGAGGGDCGACDLDDGSPPYGPSPYASAKAYAPSPKPYGPSPYGGPKVAYSRVNDGVGPAGGTY